MRLVLFFIFNLIIAIFGNGFLITVSLEIVKGIFHIEEFKVVKLRHYCSAIFISLLLKLFFDGLFLYGFTINSISTNIYYLTICYSLNVILFFCMCYCFNKERIKDNKEIEIKEEKFKKETIEEIFRTDMRNEIKANREDPCYYDPQLQIDFATTILSNELVKISDFRTGFGYRGEVRKNRLERIFKYLEENNIDLTRKNVIDRYNEYLDYYPTSSFYDVEKKIESVINKEDNDLVNIDDIKFGNISPEFCVYRKRFKEIFNELKRKNIPCTKRNVLDIFNIEIEFDTSREREISNNKVTKRVMKARKEYLIRRGVPECDIEDYEFFEYNVYKKRMITGTIEHTYTSTNHLSYDGDEFFEDYVFANEYNEWKKEH